MEADVRLVWTILVVAACSGESVGLDGGDTDADTVDCTGAEAYVAGMSEVSTSGYTVAIVSASPTPPDVGDNTWTLEVTDDAGAGVEGLTIDVKPWMPLHGHGLSPARYSGTDAGGGTYSIETFDLIMPGLWEFNVEVDGAADTVMFPLCAEG